MARGRRLLAKTLALLLGIALFTPALSTALATTAHAEPGSEEAQFFALTNQLRAQHGHSKIATCLRARHNSAQVLVLGQPVYDFCRNLRIANPRTSGNNYRVERQRCVGACTGPTAREPAAHDHRAPTGDRPAARTCRGAAGTACSEPTPGSRADDAYAGADSGSRTGSGC